MRRSVQKVALQLRSIKWRRRRPRQPCQCITAHEEGKSRHVRFTRLQSQPSTPTSRLKAEGDPRVRYVSRGRTAAKNKSVIQLSATGHNPASRARGRGKLARDVQGMNERHLIPLCLNCENYFLFSGRPAVEAAEGKEEGVKGARRPYFALANPVIYGSARRVADPIINEEKARLVRTPPAKASRVQSPAGFSQVGIVPDDAAGQRVFSGISDFPALANPVLHHTHLASPSSALKTSMSRATQIPSLTLCVC
ncbi:hypothetical protein PR048_021072 [Dryococelus australis]|uniref:Uncharacterized protein n=1 Tax=Dryococelus australis TaxID=614101 RepID=A0ABQ9GX81_9NEOP|nr:hypothetical protein PR048_021072 [Dryococelus australis]